ncbi:MAG: selenocysteine-specific translation elongation factor [Actinobacteria bacterium]|nr:selenocysteine-specific translation elongation factor [Actinomycetota bacterium]
MPLTIGTAGHIDHGKTWLVRALTGKNTDRLPEEQRRGISIDLGYAPLELEDGRRLSVVDVPGHERFVRTMVAGAAGVDLFLLVVDAGEGPRPQTHEHLAILRLLGIERGVVAVTKADAVDDEVLEFAVEIARELVPGSEVVTVSARTGVGIDELRAAIGRAADDIEQARVDGPVRLYIDRRFTLRGIGMVVTGTLWSGTIGAGDELVLQPSGRVVRVRSVQVHDRDVERAEAGQRVAVSLPGVERAEAIRGDALVQRGGYPVSYRLDVVLDELEPIRDGARVQVHAGTAHVAARVVRVGELGAQLRLAAPVVAARGDRVILRAETTLGGGRVIDPAPPRHRDDERMTRVERGDAAATVHAPVAADSLRFVLDGEPEGVERAGSWIFSRAWLDGLVRELRSAIEAADLIDPGVSTPSESWATDVLPLLPFERRGAKLYLPGAVPSIGAREQDAERLVRELGKAGVRATKVEDDELTRFLEAGGGLVRLGKVHAIAAESYETAREALLAECASAGEITLARFRDLLDIGRRDAQLLLERFDQDGLTRRIGDRRVLRRSAQRA